MGYVYTDQPDLIAALEPDFVAAGLDLVLSGHNHHLEPRAGLSVSARVRFCDLHWCKAASDRRGFPP